MAKVLITGAFGFLGNYFRNSFRMQNYNISTMDVNSNADYCQDISKNILKFDVKFNMVVHAAGFAHVLPKNKLQENLFYNINYQGTVNICKALEDYLPDTFIFISTISVYGRERGEKLNEKEPLLGTTPYAKSKIMAENFLKEWADKKLVDLVILRLPLVAGQNSKGNLGSMVHGIKNGYYFNIRGSNAKKSIVLAEDIADLLPTLNGKNGTFNLSGNKDYSFEEVSRIIANQIEDKHVFTLPYLLVKILARIGDVLVFLPINSSNLNKILSSLTISDYKAKKELGWTARSLDHYKI